MSYENADYYDCLASENFSQESPEEALGAYLDAWIVRGNHDVHALIRECESITVVGYRRDTVTEEWVRSVALHFCDELIDAWEEDYGDPENGAEFKRQDLAAKLGSVIRGAITGVQVWRCSPCGERTYSAEEVEAMMRKCCPHWFKEAKP